VTGGQQTMKKIIFMITLIIIMFMAIFTCYAAELYLWTDANGVQQITDTPPPPRMAKGKVEKDSDRLDNPQTIENSQKKNAITNDRSSNSESNVAQPEVGKNNEEQR
jgi:hypothetical protein